MSQLSLMPRFNGPDLQPADHERLADQITRIRTLMLDGKWRMLCEISTLTRSPEASVSAQLRNLRKPRFGGYTVNRRYLGGGCYEYAIDTTTSE